MGLIRPMVLDFFLWHSRPTSRIQESLWAYRGPERKQSRQGGPSYPVARSAEIIHHLRPLACSDRTRRVKAASGEVKSFGAAAWGWRVESWEDEEGHCPKSNTSSSAKPAPPFSSTVFSLFWVLPLETSQDCLSGVLCICSRH